MPGPMLQAQMSKIGTQGLEAKKGSSLLAQGELQIRTGPRLPNELISQIIDHLHKDQAYKSLAQFASCSKDYYELIAPKLHETLIITDRAKRSWIRDNIGSQHPIVKAYTRRLVLDCKLDCQKRYFGLSPKIASMQHVDLDEIVITSTCLSELDPRAGHKSSDILSLAGLLDRLSPTPDRPKRKRIVFYLPGSQGSEIAIALLGVLVKHNKFRSEDMMNKFEFRNVPFYAYSADLYFDLNATVSFAAYDFVGCTPYRLRGFWEAWLANSFIHFIRTGATRERSVTVINAEKCLLPFHFGDESGSARHELIRMTRDAIGKKVEWSEEEIDKVMERITLQEEHPSRDQERRLGKPVPVGALVQRSANIEVDTIDEQ
jgi:hypothetical protein